MELHDAAALHSLSLGGRKKKKRVKKTPVSPSICFDCKVSSRILWIPTVPPGSPPSWPLWCDKEILPSWDVRSSKI